MPPLWLILTLYLPAINVAAFASFGLDKARSRRGEWRLRERDLLFLAAIGGTVGAYLGRRHFRHKTRKACFSVGLHLVAVTQILLLIIFAP